MPHLEERRGRVQVVAGQRERLPGRPHRVPELHPLVPDRIPDPIGQGADVGATCVQEDDVDVGLEAELRTAVAPHRDQRDVTGAALGFGGGEEVGEPVVDEVAVGPAQRSSHEGSIAFQRSPSRRQCHAPVSQVRCRSDRADEDAGGPVDRIPGGRERRRVREVEVDQLLDAQSGVERHRERVDPLGGPVLPHDLSAEQPTGAALGHELHRHRLGVGQVPGDGGGVDGGGHRREALLLRLPFGEAGARHLEGAHLGDRGAEHAREGGVPATEVDARHATLLVGDGAEGDVDRPARDQVMRLAAVARGVHPVEGRPLSPVDAQRAAGSALGPCVAGQLAVGRDAQAEHHQVGAQHVARRVGAPCPARTRPPASPAARRSRGRAGGGGGARPCRRRACSSAGRIPRRAVTSAPQRTNASAISRPM